MKLIDLTSRIANGHRETQVRREEWKLKSTVGPRTAAVYYMNHWGMSGTYIDLPGHLLETDDGNDAANYPIEKLWRVPATVIRLDRSQRPGKIDLEELQAACPDGRITGQALIINALGKTQWNQVPDRSVYLTRRAIGWIIESGIHLLISDVYESNEDPQDMFYDLFAAKVLTVCAPANLHLLTRPQVLVTALPLAVATVTQLPCRLLAEVSL